MAGQISRLRHSRRARLALVLAATVVYVAAFLPLYWAAGGGIAALVSLPVALAAWFFGLRWGLVAGVVSLLLNTALLSLAGEPGWDAGIRSGSLPGFGALLTLILVIGHLRDLRERLQQQLTERARVELALREREQQYRHLVERTNDIVWELDEAVVYTYCSPTVGTVLGYEPEHVVGKTPFDFMPPDEAERVAEAFHQIVATREPFTSLEHKSVRQDGRVLVMDCSGAPIFDSDGTFRGYRGTDRDVTARKQAEDALLQAKDEAEQANRAKSQFLSSMSHELRTPLTAIIGFAQLLETDASDPLTAGQHEGVMHIRKAGDHLLELVNEVLDLARIESERISLSLESVTIGPLLEEVVAIVEPMATERDITLRDQTASLHHHSVVADRNRLKQVLLNLLSNAIKYNRPAGAVTLAGTVSPRDRVRLSVRDEGEGIPEEQLAVLFAPFERLGAENTSVVGTGIGLTITKRLLELMDGCIEVESVVGEGSCFSIELPRGEHLAALVEESPLERPALVLDADEHQRTVLYVEDNPATVALVERIIARRPQIKLLVAPQAQMGLELAQAYRPDLIMLDVNLPGMSGYEALEWLQRYEDTRDIPVLALSANAMLRDVERGLAAGFTAYLTKPINVAKLLETLDRVLEEAPTVLKQNRSAPDGEPAPLQQSP